MDGRRKLGQAGEDYAERMLVQAGLEIVRRNYRCPKGETDIIARDRGVLVFVEVRTRQSGIRGWGEESVTWQKQRRMQDVAAYYILQARFAEWPPIRFDVIALQWDEVQPRHSWLQGVF